MNKVEVLGKATNVKTFTKITVFTIECLHGYLNAKSFEKPEEGKTYIFKGKLKSDAFVKDNNIFHKMVFFVENLERFKEAHEDEEVF